ATAMEFLPGQLETNTPRSDAALTSMVSIPAPARITRLRLVPLRRASPVTFVPRTMSTLGSCSLRATGSASAVRSGSDTTVQPSSLSPSMPTFSNLSAMRIFIDAVRYPARRRPQLPAWTVAGRSSDSGWLIELMHKQSAPQLGLEPGALGGHDGPDVGHGEQLVHRGRKQRYGEHHLARLHPSLQFGCAPNAAHEVHPLVGS